MGIEDVKRSKDWFLSGASSSPNKYTLSDGLINRIVNLEPPKKKELFIRCECQGEVLKVEKWEDEEDYYITVFKYSFPSVSFLRRIKYAIQVLQGRGIRTADIVLSEKSFNKIKKFK